DPQRQADDAPLAVANRRDAVQRALDAGPVVVAELADPRDDVLDVLGGDLAVVERDLPPGEARLGRASQVHHHLEQPLAALELDQRGVDVRRKRVQQRLKVVGYEPLHARAPPAETLARRRAPARAVAPGCEPPAGGRTARATRRRGTRDPPAARPA